ncbi:MAG: HD domain-containing protein [Thermodesulfobacteriota bacterium]
MKCPGQDSRYWTGHDVFEAPCPKCGTIIEFFKDDSTRPCGKCGYRMFNPQINFGCAEYCPHAEQCLGALPEGLRPDEKQGKLRTAVSQAMRDYFAEDGRRIKHAEDVADFAERINRYEQGDPAVIMACGYLHDIGIREAERKFNSSAAKYQHSEGPAVARQLLTELAVEEDIIAEVCDIIGHHHQPRAEESTNFKVLYDADLIVNIQDEQAGKQRTTKQINKIISKAMLTRSGQQIARQLFNIEE